MYPETTQGAFFAFDDSGLLLDKTCFMFTSHDALYLQRILSSKLYEYAYKHIFSSVALGIHGYQYNKHALVKLPVAKPDAYWKKRIEDADIEILDELVYSLYGITQAEVSEIENTIYQTDSM